MAGNKSGEITKEKILDAAKEEFLINGISNSSLENIAKRAGVTRLMLYYHFESKEKIANELFLKILYSAKSEFQKIFTSVRDFKKASPELFIRKIEELIEPQKKLLILFITENIRNPLESSSVKREAFCLIREIYDIILENLETRGLKQKDKETLVIRLFFFQSMPLIMYFVFGDDMASFFQIDKEKLKNEFGKKFIQTMVQTILEK